MFGLDTVSVAVTDQDALRATQSQLRLEKVALEDQLAELNYATKVEIPEDVVAVLKSHDLV